MNEDLLIIKLRDCFTAGYTLPQFCIDNNIKKPLFVAVDERRADFLWEIYVQLKYDRRITPRFILLNGKIGAVTFAEARALPEMFFEPFNVNILNECDRVFFISDKKEAFNLKISNVIYLDRLTDYFITKTYAEIPILHFLQKYPEVKLIVTNLPTVNSIKDKTFRKSLIATTDFGNLLSADINGRIPRLYDVLGYNNKELLKAMFPTNRHTDTDGAIYYEDNSDPFFGIKNGKRMTAYQPEKYINTIYFVGTCHQYGVYAPYNKTIESYLQKMINDNNLPYRVENEGRHFATLQQVMFYNLAKLNPKPNDIIFIFVTNIIPSSLPFIDVSNALDSHDYKKIWVDHGHMNEIGYKILAEKYFQFLVQNNFFKNTKIKYSAPPRRLIVTAYRKKIHRPQQNFSIRQSWRRTKNLYANGGLKSVA